MRNKLIQGLWVLLFVGAFWASIGWAFAGKSPSSLFVAYPPKEHQTTSDRIFLIGTAPPQGTVTVNDQAINRSQWGHFAPSFPLQLGENQFQLRYQQQSITLQVLRRPRFPTPPQQPGFLVQSLFPAQNIKRPIGERLCFQAVGTPGARVTAQVGQVLVELQPTDREVALPENAAVLTDRNQPLPLPTGTYGGCAIAQKTRNLGKVRYRLEKGTDRITQNSLGSIEIVAPETFQAIVTTAPQAIARSGPGSDFSRLTPLPQGTVALVTAQEGDWLRLEYGGWIEKKETRSVARATPPHSVLRSVTSRNRPRWTDILFPLQVPVPISLQHHQQTFTLTLHHVTAQTDTTRLVNNPIIDRMDAVPLPNEKDPKIEFRFALKQPQLWGYTTRYEGTTLILSLRHPPRLGKLPLTGTQILLDPGHGSANDLGARGPNGYPEKDVTLTVSRLLAQELRQRGATIGLTRYAEEDIFPLQRAQQIERDQPTLSLSIHYNALPDYGDAEHTQGIGTFWYHPQSHDLAQFLHDYLVKNLNRASYGVFWNNLAVTRPTVAPAVLLELGFMIHPEEFAWITDTRAQQKLAKTLANGITTWVQTHAQ